MRSRFAIAACALSALAFSPAWAAIDAANAPQGAHYRQGFGDPVCTVSGLSVSCGGTQIAGIGNTDADVALSVSYSATVQCRNHGGKIVDVKTQVTTTNIAPDEVTEVRNGTLIVAPYSSGAATPSNDTFLGLATCPNPNWDKLLLGSPTVSSFRYTLTFDGFSDPAIVVTGP